MKHIFAVFIGAASYGILSTFVVLAYSKGYRLGEVVGTQLLIGFLLLAMLTFFFKIRTRKRLGNTDQSVNQHYEPLNFKKVLMLMAAGIPQATTGLLYYSSLQYIPASFAIIMLFQFIWISVLIQAIRTRKIPPSYMGIAIVIVLAGTVLAAGVFEEGGMTMNWAGIGFGLLAAISYTLFIIISGNVQPKANPVSKSMWMIGGAFLFVCLLFPPDFLFNGKLWSDLLLYGFLLGLFGACIPPLLFAYGVPHVGEGMAGILGAVELPVAVAMSALILHEQVGVIKWLGVAIVLLGVIVPELYKRNRRDQLYYGA